LRKDPKAIEKHVFNWNHCGRRKRGRPKRTRRRTVEEEIGKVGKTRKESAGDASRKPHDPEGVKGIKSSK
jgi:hypothetical protein